MISEETRRKMSEAHKGRITSPETRKKLSFTSSGERNGMFGKTPWNKGKPMSQEQKEKLRAAKLGTKLSQETKDKISRGGKGQKRTRETRKNISESLQEEKGPRWKGDKVGYSGVHKWVKKHLPKPEKCPMCQKTPERMDLHNINKKYQRTLSPHDWVWLCKRCHGIIETPLIDENGRYLKGGVIL